jgi:hypothetical protein
VSAAGAGSLPVALVADPVVPGRVFLGSWLWTDRGVFRSEDGGLSCVHLLTVTRYEG